MSGGQKFDEFITKHFTKVGEKNPRTNRWKMKRSHRAPDAVVEHRELRFTEHLQIRTVSQCRAIQSLPVSRSEEGGGETELMGFEDITTEEFDTEFDRLQLTPLDPQNANAASWPSPPSPNEVYNLDEIGMIWKRIAPQPAREEPTGRATWGLGPC